MSNDTIASISTALSESGIGMIRVSGDKAVDLIDRIYIDKNHKHTLSDQKSHTIHYGFIVNSNGDIIDEVMVSIMKAPNSYTREDIVEINCHGGIRVCRNILDTVLNTGARLAEPGEFTKRAFLNGRLDLTRAEAVMDTIRAESDIALDQSVKQLNGNLYELLDNICSDILYEIAHIEAALDDPDSISLDNYDKTLLAKIKDISVKITELIGSYDEGRIISEGIKTVILGLPNAGKSSLLNALLNEERAIVTDIPGTTRDMITEKVRLNDITLILTDTAGLRHTDDPIEHIGVTRAINEASDADLIIYIMDLDKWTADKPVISDASAIDLLRDKKNIILLNKSDLNTNAKQDDKAIIQKVSDALNKLKIYPQNIIKTSMVTRDGIDTLKESIKSTFYNGDLTLKQSIIITNLRHVTLLKESLKALNRVSDSIMSGVSEDLYCIDLTDAYRSLASITGAEVSEDIVNEIFSKFCMGK